MANIINGTDTGSGGLITTGDSSDELQLQTAEVARVTLTNTAVVVNESGADVDFRVEGDTDANLLFVDASADAVGIGEASPPANTKLTVKSDASNQQYVDVLRLQTTNTGDVHPSIFFQNNRNSVANTAKISMDSGTAADTGILNLSAPATLRFLTGTSGGSERVRVTSDGYLRMASGTGGIQFNGDTAAANALDDYEEGTWTPGQGSGLVVVGAYSSSGRYTKIGRFVYVSGRITAVTSVTTTAGSQFCTGLPFTVLEGTALGDFTNSAITHNGGLGAFGTQVYASTSMSASTDIDFNVVYQV